MLKLQKLSVSSKIADDQLLLKVSVKPHKFTGEIKMEPLLLGLQVTLKLVLLLSCPPLGFSGLLNFFPLWLQKSLLKSPRRLF